MQVAGGRLTSGSSLRAAGRQPAQGSGHHQGSRSHGSRGPDSSSSQPPSGGSRSNQQRSGCGISRLRCPGSDRPLVACAATKSRGLKTRV
jgi:hypothetical protein